jgi:ABC-2 type transport system permease protein
MSALTAVYGAELRKLRAQPRVWVVTGVVAVAPWAFILLLKGQDRLPTDQLYGRYLTTTGFATPLVILGFLASWAFPLLTAIVSGDIFATEDQQGTIKTILTRSVSRTATFWGKVLTAISWSVAIVTLLAVSSTLAGVAIIGHQQLPSASGTLYSPGKAIGLIAASWGSSLLPFLGFACLSVMVSVLAKNSVLGVMLPVVLGFFMQLYAFLNGKDVIRHNLLTTPFLAWHGLLHDTPFYQPLIRGAAVSAVYAAASLLVAYTVFRRRDITGG